MSNNLHELFQIAAKFFYKKYRREGGVLDDLAGKIGITPTYLSAVINGSRICSLDLQNKIAKTFYGPYDKFIAVGRRLAKGEEPLKNKTNTQDSVESTITHLTHLVMSREHINRKLLASEQKFKDISLTSGDMIFELDENLNITFLSGKVIDTVGHHEEELLGKNVSQLYNKKEWEKLAPLIEHAITHRNIIDTVITINKPGKTFYHHCIATPTYENNRNFSGFRGTYRDITNRKLLELRLLDEVTLFQAAIDSVKEYAIVITDKNNKVVRWNKAYQDMMSFPQEIIEKERISHNFAFLMKQLKNPDDFRKELIEVFSSQQKTVHYFEMKDGKTIKRVAAPIYRDGIFAGRVTFFYDVTEKKENDSKIRV